MNPSPPGYSVGAPGTPFAFANPGLTTLVITEGANSPVPQPVGATSNYGITNVATGDVIFLLDPNGGQARSNWAAVLSWSSDWATVTLKLFVPIFAPPACTLAVIKTCAGSRATTCAEQTPDQKQLCIFR